MPRWTFLVPPALLASLLAASLPPGTRAECLFSRGDLAPGELDASYAVPLWSPQGDGQVDVGDVITLMRSSVGLQRLAVPRPEDGACPLIPGDFAPGELDESTVPPTWRVIGDGMIGVGDVIAQLRSAVGLQALAPPTERAALRPFASCRELEHWVKQTALESLELYGTWSVPWWDWGGALDETLDGDGGPLPTAGGGESAASRSETNTQVEGVDEDDIVETDGRYLYVISSDGLRVVDAWPAENLSLVAHVPIEGRPTGAFLNGDRLLVLSSHWEAPRPLAGGPVALDPSLGLLKLSFFDVADPSAPLMLRELYFEGYLQAARRVDDRVLLVTHHALRGPRMPDWTGDSDAWRLAQRRAVEDSGLDDWLPRSVDLVRQDADWQRITRHVAGCTDLQRPDLPDGAGFTALTTLDLQDPSFLGRNGIFAATGAVFANADRVELSSHAWPQGVWWGWGERPETRLHSFDLGADLSAPRYFGSGEVPGSVFNQFSMDVREGLLRVATTTGAWNESTNAVHVLERSSPPEKKALSVIGALTGLAPGETIQAVRFVGDIGWVVTFRTTDPLFAIDLSDPTQPTVSGELHVTGFSSYLHPMDRDHLIGVGTEVDPETGRQVGLQVSLFDISDLSSPQLAARDVIATGASTPEALQQDHHAFTWSGEHEALALPVVQSEQGPSGWSTSFNGLRLYRVDPVAGILRLGDLPGVETAPETDPFWNPWCGQVRRSVFLEDKVYAVSELGVVVASLDDLEHPLAQLSFGRPNGCWHY